MPGIYMAMEIARKAMFTNQMAIQVTSNNIANVNTPGFSRQEAVITEANAMSSTPGQIGMGSIVTGIRQIVDSLTEHQLATENGTFASLDYTAGAIGQVEGIFNDTTGASLADRVNEYFNAWDDLSANPQGTAERQSVVSTAELLTAEFRRVDYQLTTLKENANKDVASIVGEVNQLVTEIASFNRDIKVAILQGQQPNDLRDQQGVLLKKLAEKIGYTSFTDALGQVNIYVANGKALVDGEQAGSLVADVDPNDSDAGLSYGIKVRLPGQTAPVAILDTITEYVTTGELGASLQFRDGYLDTVRGRVDQLAYAINTQTNAQHYTGYGLATGTPPTVPTGKEFFTPLAAIQDAARNFQVNPDMSTNINNVAAAGPTRASGSIVFTGVPAVTPASGPPPPFTPPGVTVDGVTYDFYDSSLGAYAGGNVGIDVHGMSTSAQVASALAAASAGSNTTMVASGGVVMILAAANGSAGNGFAIVKNGDDPANSIVLSGPQTAGGVDSPTPPPPPGDNRNAVTMAGLRNVKIPFLADGTSIPDYIAGLVGQIGSETKGVDQDLEHQRAVVHYLETRREQVSGVSLDEEMTNLIKFQRGFQAATKMIAIIDGLLEDVINLKQ